MDTSLINKNIQDVFGLYEMSDAEQLTMLDAIGDLILESALARLFGELTEEQIGAIEAYVETRPEPSVLMKHLLTHYALFSKILEEEVIAFKEEAIAVMQRSDRTVTT